MKNTIVITQNTMTMDGEDITKEVLGWSYSRQGADMVFVVNRLVMVKKEGREELVALGDDREMPCFYQYCCMNPKITIDIDGTKPNIIVAQKHLN